MFLMWKNLVHNTKKLHLYVCKMFLFFFSTWRWWRQSISIILTIHLTHWEIFFDRLANTENDITTLSNLECVCLLLFIAQYSYLPLILRRLPTKTKEERNEWKTTKRRIQCWTSFIFSLFLGKSSHVMKWSLR